MNELLKNHFKVSETSKVEAEIAKDPSFNEVYTEIKEDPNFKMYVLEERTEDNVEKTDETFAERLVAFKEMLLKRKKEKSLTENLTDNIGEKAKKKASEILKERRAEAVKKHPYIGGFLFDIASDFLTPTEAEAETPTDKKGIFSKFFSSIFSPVDSFFKELGKKAGLAICAYLGIKWAIDKPEGEDSFDSDNSKPIEADNTSVDEGNESLDLGKNKDFYYITGINSLTHLAGISLEHNDSTKNSAKIFRGKSLEELRNIKKTGEFKGKTISEVDKKFLTSVLSDNSNILFKSSLKKEVVKTTMENNTLKMEALLGETEYRLVLELLKEKTFDIEKIPLNTLSILSFFSLNSFGLLAIDGVKSKFEGMFEDFTTKETIAEIEEELSSRKGGIISKELLIALNKDTSIHLLDAYGNDESIRTKLVDFEDKAELERLLKFKDWVLSDDFLGENSKTLLSKYGKVDEFKENITFAGIIALYTIFGGKPDMRNINTIELPIMYKIISIILSRQNSASGPDYLTRVFGYFTLNNSSDEIFKDENDKKAISIIQERLIKDSLMFYVTQIKESLGYVGLFNDKFINDGLAIASGVVAKKMGSKAIKTGAVLKGSLLKKFGYIAIISGIASGIKTTYNKGSQLIGELGKFNKTEEELLSMSEEDLDAMLSEAKNLNKKIINKPVEINGETKDVVLFLGDDGLEVIHDGNVYKLLIGFSRLGSFETISRDIVRNYGVSVLDFYERYIKTEIPSDLADVVIGSEEFEELVNNPLRTFRGKEYDSSKIKIEGEKIIIGDGSSVLNIPMEDFLLKLINSKEEHPEKLIGTEVNASITFKTLIEGDNENENIVLIKQGEIKVS